MCPNVHAILTGGLFELESCTDPVLYGLQPYPRNPVSMCICDPVTNQASALTLLLDYPYLLMSAVCLCYWPQPGLLTPLLLSNSVSCCSWLCFCVHTGTPSTELGAITIHYQQYLCSSDISTLKFLFTEAATWHFLSFLCLSFPPAISVSLSRRAARIGTIQEATLIISGSPFMVYDKQWSPQYWGLFIW